MKSAESTGALSAPLNISFDYTRSLGPTLSQFMTALKSRRILAARGSDGRVHAPPFEYDPVTAEPAGELTEVGPEGTVISWTWASEPLEGQPLDKPFGWALIRLDGADTAFLHAVDIERPALRTGLRVRPRWAAEPSGHIRDIECFEAAAGEPPAAGRPAAADGAGDAGEVTMITTPVALGYQHFASPTETSHLRGLGEGRMVGQRCPSCRKVYIPPRGACPTCGVPTDEDVELPDTGIVTTFCVVNVPFAGQKVKPPYVAASVLIDGADIAFQHLVLGCDADEVHMGMRVRAAWKPREEWGVTMENVSHFEPTGEADAPYESYSHHL
ncbi:MAG: OB-fold domain-containing protein [Streptosporangiales bacterium]|nr:OB-fold domain-containing protein [Streptosporangiales bacterium]